MVVMVVDVMRHSRELRFHNPSEFSQPLFFKGKLYSSQTKATVKVQQP